MTPKSIQRRNFIKTASAVSLASFYGLLPSLHAETLPVKRVGGPFLKTSLNAYSFDALLKANLKDSTKGLDFYPVGFVVNFINNPCAYLNYNFIPGLS